VTSNELNNNRAPLYGLVLAGGKSTRMGTDKAAIIWHTKEQHYYVADMLLPFCADVYISCRPEQQSDIDPAYKTIPDSVNGSGPIIAIMSAFKVHPHAAWLIVACDLPLLDKATIDYLIQNRDTNKIATTFRSPFDSLPEPLITIWEPCSRNLLQPYLNDGFKCPRKLLIRNEEEVSILIPPNPDALLNANTPEDAIKVREHELTITRTEGKPL
jgi:molybdopterin-guanine dinucleotide biosynthesis protein A